MEFKIVPIAPIEQLPLTADVDRSLPEILPLSNQTDQRFLNPQMTTFLPPQNNHIHMLPTPPVQPQPQPQIMRQTIVREYIGDQYF